jgi:hypothetical protein
MVTLVWTYCYECQPATTSHITLFADPVDGYIDMIRSRLQTLPRFHPERPPSLWLVRLNGAMGSRFNSKGRP